MTTRSATKKKQKKAKQPTAKDTKAAQAAAEVRAQAAAQKEAEIEEQSEGEGSEGSSQEDEAEAVDEDQLQDPDPVDQQAKQPPPDATGQRQAPTTPKAKAPSVVARTRSTATTHQYGQQLQSGRSIRTWRAATSQARAPKTLPQTLTTAPRTVLDKAIWLEEVYTRTTTTCRSTQSLGSSTQSWPKQRQRSAGHPSTP